MMIDVDVDEDVRLVDDLVAQNFLYDIFEGHEPNNERLVGAVQGRQTVRFHERRLPRLP